MGWFSSEPKPKVDFIKKGNKIKVVETSFERGPNGKVVEVTTEEYLRPTDKKLEKIAAKTFKLKGDVYFSGTVQKRGDVGHITAGLKDLFVPRGGQKKPKHVNQPLNRDGSPRSSWW